MTDAALIFFALFLLAAALVGATHVWCALRFNETMAGAHRLPMPPKDEGGGRGGMTRLRAMRNGAVA